MPQMIPDNVAPAIPSGQQNLGKAMAEASYQVGIHAADITGHVEDINHRIADQTELMGTVTQAISEMTSANARIAGSAQHLLAEANAVTDRISAAHAIIKGALIDATALIGTREDCTPDGLARALARIAQASSEFDQIARLRDHLVARVTDIAEATAHNHEHCEEVSEDIVQLNEAEAASRSDAETVSAMCLHLSDLSAELYYTILASGVETADTPFIKAVIDTARRVTEALEDALDRGEIDLDTLFDEDYVQMPDIEPPKYTTRWLPLIERLASPICEPVSTMTPDVVLCTVTDRNGYMPINNLRHAHPPTDDPVWNATYSRHRIRHRDRISERISKSVKPFLVMVFRRGLGDHTQVLKDVSAPIFIRGRLWGNVRMLILIRVETVDYVIKQMDIHRALAKIRDDAGTDGAGEEDGEDEAEDGPSFRRRGYPRKFCVHHGGRLVVIDNGQIQLFFAKDRMVFIQTEDGKQYPIRSTLAELEEKLDNNQFMRCHRNYIVNMEHVDYLNNWFNRGYLLILKGKSQTEVPVSRVFVKRLKKYIEFE